jgi:quercetin dioxygenase-like cupin family protein
MCVLALYLLGGAFSWCTEATGQPLRKATTVTTYPIQIDNGHGEVLTFERLVPTPDGGRLEVSNIVQPKAGPPMHVHYLQDEGLTVVAGRMGYQIAGEQPRSADVGESVTFKRGVAHRFWAEGDQPLHASGYIEPANNIVDFLSAVYRSMRANGGRPGAFDAAYLLHRYRSEFALLDIPPFVARCVFPLLRVAGGLTGRFEELERGQPPRS